MTPFPGSSDPPSLAVRLRVDDACAAFEEAFRREPASRIEPFVPPAGSPDRADTLAELIRTEREARQAAGDAPGVGEYLARFPCDAATVRAAVADALLRSGDRVEKYLVGERLGAGGMGVVYRADDLVVGRPIALKVLSARFSASASARDRLLAEARSVGRVSHPNVITLYEAGDTHETCYLAMEYVTGGSAADRLAAAGPFPWRDAMAVMVEVCRGLAAAHAVGLIHLDIKPANILLPAAPAGVAQAVRAKLSDFGLARHAAEDGDPARVAGTPAYMAPEQAAGRPADARTDVYGVGATLYALLTGHPPSRADLRAAGWAGPDPRAGAPDVPAVVARVVRRALCPTPADRYQSIGELLRALEGLAEPWRGYGRGLAAAVGILLVIACAFAVREATRLGGESPHGPPVPAAPRAPEPPLAMHGAAPTATVVAVPTAVRLDAPGPWEPLFDGKSLAGWEVLLHPNGLGVLPASPRGPEGVFSVTRVDGRPAIRATPQGLLAYLTTTRAFENYQLRLEYRWGAPPPGRRNSGVMYHFRLSPATPSVAAIVANEFDLWPPEVGKLHYPREVFIADDLEFGRASRGAGEGENPPPAWNRIDLLCAGGRAAHAVNGRVVVAYADARVVKSFGTAERRIEPYTSGRLQLQANIGEIFFRDVQVRPISDLSESLLR